MTRYNFNCGRFSKYFKTSGLAIASLLFIDSPWIIFLTASSTIFPLLVLGIAGTFIISEGLVVGQDFNDDVRIILFVTTKNNQELDDNKVKSIKSRIRINCSPKHVPSLIIKVPAIPRTKSGKIVELAVRKIIHGEPINNKEAIANPDVLKYFENLPQLKS